MIVTLDDQLASAPAGRSGIGERRTRAKAQQKDVLVAAGIPDDQRVVHYTLVNGFAADVTAAQAAKLAADPAVKSVVADSTVDVDATGPQTAAPGGTPNTRARPATPAGDSAAICPKKPTKPLLEPEALTTLRATQAQQQATGSGVRIAVFAEAIDPDAPDYIRSDGTSAIVDYQDFSGVPDGTAGDTYGQEIFGDASALVAQGRVVHDLADFVHATHPLPAGCTIQIRGMAPNAEVVALKILSEGTGYDYATASSMAQAIDYAVTVGHVDVLSESVGAMGMTDSPGAADVVQQFNDAAVRAGVTVVAAAGDAGTTGTILSPAADPLVISAAGSTTLRSHMQVGYTGTSLSNGKWINGNIASISSGGYTSSGTVPVLTAPADAGWAACTDKTLMPGCTTMSTDAQGRPRPSSIELFGGTSQSAPFIAGAAALVIQAYRDSHRGKSPSPAVIRQILTSTATDLGAPSFEQGAGQVDALAAVRLAKGYDGKPQADGTLLLSNDQFTNVGAQGSSAVNTIKVTNTGTAAVPLKPQVRRLSPIAAPHTVTVQLNPKTDPRLDGASGSVVTYQKVRFTVKPGAAHVAIALSYPSASDFESSGGQPQVSVSLLDPDGAYAGNSRPQGGSGSSNYGNIDIVRPQAGTWTAIVSTMPTSTTFLGQTIPGPAYTGPVQVSVTQNKWVSAGVVSPARAKVGAGSTATFAVSTRMPGAAGDSSATLTLGAPETVSQASVAIVQRVLVAMPAGTGRFTGGITGGNGRALQPAQTQTFAVDVPAGRPALDVTVNTASSSSIPRLLVSLVGPNGQVQSTQNNADPAAGKSAVSRTVVATTANPVPGRWHIVVRTVAPSTGQDIVVPFTATVKLASGSVTSPELSGLSTRSAGVPADQYTAVAVKITNPTGAPQTYYADPRTTRLEQVQLGSIQAVMPTPVTAAVLRNLLVPPGTTSLSATLNAPVPLRTLLSGPTAPVLLSGPNALGGAGLPVNGTATSTATMSVSSGTLTTGNYSALAGSVGPYGGSAAPSAVAVGTATATTPAFDPSIEAEGGDPFTSRLSTATGVTIPAGHTATLTLRLRPTAKIGTEVSGVVNIVQKGNDGVYGGLLAPGQVSTYQVVAALPYHYRVGSKTPSITGTIGTPDAPVAKVKAIAYSPDGSVADYGITDSTGRFSIGGLTPGSYSLCFNASEAIGPLPAGYLSQCYDQQAWDGSGPPPTGSRAVKAPATGIVQTLPAGAGVSGTLVDQAGTKVRDASVLVFDKAGKKIAETTTGSDGSYRISGLPEGDVHICTAAFALDNAPGGGYLDQCGGNAWDGLSPVDSTYPTSVLVPGKITTQDLVLEIAGVVTGTVTGVSGKPQQVLVMAMNAAGDMLQLSSTDSTGKYQVRRLSAGTYYLCALSLDPQIESACHRDAVWAGFGSPVPAQAVPVTVGSGRTTSGIDVVQKPASKR
ncbi:S8 family serine peptidase [Micromonospora sp. WMMD710]|uniref:S8 family serine peptidase n=1 Tax=Micromonospora sp. WMMD710 TaxID=3016085 RepID=UPI002415A898|nr:S8 family serine peptidase [Micromonospora sp. WMMD710]MDG4758196.1 S8 family serine peptidase [Micromonospora sp. WMMD710]